MDFINEALNECKTYEEFCEKYADRCSKEELGIAADHYDNLPSDEVETENKHDAIVGEIIASNQCPALIDIKECDKENGFKDLPPETDALKDLVDLVSHKRARIKALSEDIKDLFAEHAKNYNTKKTIISKVVAYRLNNVMPQQIEEEAFEIKSLLKKIIV